MYTSSVRSLRADLATAIRRAQSGESTIVTVSGRPAARLGPIADGTDVGDESAGSPAVVTLDQLIAAGAVIAAPRRDRWRPGEPVPVWPGTRIDQALREVR